MSTPVLLGGVKVGRVRASFILLKESFRFLWADKEMLWVPIITLFLQLVLIGAFVVVAFFAGILSGLESETVGVGENVTTFATVLIFYTLCAYIVVSAQATITHIVQVRVHGGDATLWQGIMTALSHASSLFVWAFITSTVGIVLRSIAERSALLTKVIVLILGTAWSILTYFTVQAIIIDKKPATNAITHSGSVFKKMWGETFVSNISLGLAFFVFYLVLIFAGIGALMFTEVSPLVGITFGILFIGVVIVSIIVSAVLDSVLRTLLYIYASEGVVPSNFNRELLEQMLARKQGSLIPPQGPSTV